jgi:hypothetical protein
MSQSDQSRDFMCKTGASKFSTSNLFTGLMSQVTEHPLRAAEAGHYSRFD